MQWSETILNAGEYGILNRKSTHVYLVIFAVFLMTLSGCSILRGGRITPTDAVTTNIKDAYPIASWLEHYTAIRSPVKGTSFDLAPGYYTFDIESYCLKAGKYAPTEGAGYLIAPLKGERAEIIRNVLQRSGEHPGIRQRDIQRLLWGIESGANFKKYNLSFQIQVSPLLTPAEIAFLSVDFEDTFSDLLPDNLKEIIKRYNKLRAMVTDAQTTYEELEQIAVRFGVAPMGPGSRNVGPGSWAYVGSGFYMRAFPQGYSRTKLEVIRPAPYSLERDSKGRITVFRSGRYRIETTYDDSPGANIVSAPGQPDIYIWRFRTIRFIGPNPGDEYVIQNRGWILASPHHRTGPVISRLPMFSGLVKFTTADLDRMNHDRIYFAQEDNLIPEEWRKAKDRVEKAKKIKDLMDKIEDYRKQQENAERPPTEEAFKDLTDLKHYRDGLDKATNPTDFEGRSEWLTKHFTRVGDAWNYVNCVLSGNCPPPGRQPTDTDEEWDDHESFDPTGNVATPANTSRQRIGLSRRRQ